MEFKFNINDVFQQPIVEINQNLIPPGFSGDRRALWDTVNKVSEVVNAMGEASAIAQGLTKPITTAERLRNSEHKLYFLIDQNANNGKGAVTGMLKTGSKGLYVFDRNGQHFQVSPPCVLDFYIHETRQRTGLGKQLFEHMLEKEEINPVKMAIDRPSDKFLGFLNKHYSLNSPVKQMNNYVVFDGFFPKHSEDADVESSKRAQIASHKVQNDVEPNPVKLERPRSLTIQPSGEPTEEEKLSSVIDTKAVEDEVDLGQINLAEEIIEPATEDLSLPSFEPDQPTKKTTPSHLTDQGYFDLKFYHNKLW